MFSQMDGGAAVFDFGIPATPLRDVGGGTTKLSSHGPRFAATPLIFSRAVVSQRKGIYCRTTPAENDAGLIRRWSAAVASADVYLRPGLPSREEGFTRPRVTPFVETRRQS